MKRLLFEVHRWLGIALAVFMLIWFFSGLLIIFAEPTTPTRAEQLSRAETLVPQPNWLSAGDVWQRSAEQRKALSSKKLAETKKATEAKPENTLPAQIVEARLQQRAGVPVWLIEDSKGQRFAVSAIDGSLHKTSPEVALEIAKNWADGNSVRFIETLDKPAILRAQENVRPFHLIAVDDALGGELLVSARTGEVVHASNRIERGMYWAGNWIHLFRPLELTSWKESRVDVLTWVSGGAVIAALTGLIVGWLRWRPGWFGHKTYSEGRVQPYRNFWFKWHFWGGLIGGTLALTWGLSGFLNNNPWQLFSPANPSKEELTRYVSGTNLSLAKSWQIAPLSEVAPNIVELSWRRLGDESVARAFTRDGRNLPQNAAETSAQFTDAALQAAVQRLAGNVPIASQTVLREYDSYYYLRHHRDVADRPLPVVRIELADKSATHLYIAPQDGRLLIKQDSSRRVYRWLYSALHHFDFGWLYVRPFWDVWMVIWVAFGLTLSVTAVVVGWKRLVLTLRPKHRKAAQRKSPVLTGSENLVTENQA